MTDLEQFLEKRYPLALRQWERKNSMKWEDIKVGDKFLMIRAGFGGSGMDVRVVKKVCADAQGLEYAEVGYEEGRAPSWANSDSVFLMYRSSPRNIFCPEDREEFWEYAVPMTEEELALRDGRFLRWRELVKEKTGKSY